MLITGIDLETTGLDTNTNKIIEVGLVLWDTDRKMPLNMYNELVFIRHDLPEEITKITGITDRDLKLYGTELNERIYEELYFYFNEADYIVAHNGNLFDKPMLINNLACYDLVLPDKPWIDTSCDIAFPDSMKTRNLKHLACEHNFINPFAHRALFDVLTMLNMVCKYDFINIMLFVERNFTVGVID
jgi:DNA polymerase-3 subunit epsilon